MKKENEIKIFEEKKVRTFWDAEQEKWYFSIIDAIEILTGTDRPRKYWSDLKAKLKKEGSQLSDKIGQLKIKLKLFQSLQSMINFLRYISFGKVENYSECLKNIY
jgi:hypothetical protein